MTKPVNKKEIIAETDEDFALMELIAQMDWSGLELSRRVAVAPSTVYNWLHGKTSVPGAVFVYLRYRLAVRKFMRDLGELDD